MTSAASGENQREESDWSAIPMDPDDSFAAISNSRRRHIILSLERAEDAVSASDLSVEIAAVENRIDPSHVTGEERTRVYISLTQSHLETLDDLGAADYDARSKQIDSTDATRPLAAHIRDIQTACYEPTEEDR